MCASSRPRRWNVNSNSCKHDVHINQTGARCIPFVQKWVQGYNEAIDKVGNMEIAFKITQAIITKDYAVWRSSESIDWVVSYFVMTATNQFFT